MAKMRVVQVLWPNGPLELVEREVLEPGAGVTHDGGYADYMIATTEALAPIPQELSAAEAAPLMCAGLTTFDALRHSGARPGEVAAVLGLGGLGHLGVQLAAKLGFNTVAIARGSDKEPLARQLGAHHYIDNAAEDAAAALGRLGGAKVILATVTSAEAMVRCRLASQLTAR